MEYRPEILWQREGNIKLGQLHSHLIGDDAESRNLPLTFHKVLEKYNNLLLTHLDQFRADLLTQVEKILKDTLAHLQANQPPPHSPPMAEPQPVEDTPKAPTGSGHSNCLDSFIPTKSGEEPVGKGKSVKKEPSPGPSHLPQPKQTRAHPEPEFFPSPSTTVEESS
ncbi:hypothetical protein OPQ81_003999 [Rhizoctonia solani]|nr:hypothetical protein OPQ81_003999 [Rhizoctonia solani]